jgi:Lantibiotic dehydratase, N terminus
MTMQTAEIADHLVRLDERWSLWREFCVRSAGFPAATVAPLAAPECAERIDEATRLERQLVASREAAIAACRRSLRHGPAVPGAVRRALERLQKGRDAETVDGLDDELVAALAPHRELARALAARREETRRLFDEAQLATAGALRAIAEHELFHEAILWQNRHVYSEGGIGSLLRRELRINAKTRERLLLASKYAYRYSLKNDAIGFFGPRGWGRFADDGAALTLRPGRGLLDLRQTYFEHWCVDALAQKLAGRPGMRPWIAPRLSPLVYLEGAKLNRPFMPPEELPRPKALALAAIDGVRPAMMVARDLVARGAPEFATVEEALAVLDELERDGVLLWGLDTPNLDAHPERYLRLLLERIEDETLRRPALAALDDLERHRDAVARAAGDPAALDARLGELEESFVHHTGVEATRRGGQVYAGRTLVFEDCRRAMDLSLGPALKEKLAAPLSLILASARWYSYELARRHVPIFEEVYETLAKETGSPRIDLLMFQATASIHFPFIAGQDQLPALGQAVQDDLRARWARVLAFEPGARHVARSSSELRGRAEAEFAAPHPGWPAARQHSPDLMIVARDVDAVVRGDYRLLLNELHLASNTLENRSILEMHPDPSRLVAAFDADLRPTRIAPVVMKNRATRVSINPLGRAAFAVLFEATPSWRPAEQTVAIAELMVERSNGELVVRTRDRRHTWDIFELFDSFLSAQYLGSFQLLPPSPHTPRVTIDELIVARETWRFDAGALAFLRLASGYERFASARRFATDHGLPRRVFVKAKGELKPFYLDFASPLSVDMFVNMVHAAPSITLSEMLPGPDELWLCDAQGGAYTSELRIVAVDREPWRAPPRPFD